jgi:3-hydroxyisobutyrate dehydrogenase-like beta-hydroxyacid dehydrogenase
MAVAVVGLGQMGTAFAERLLDAGHEVFVANRTPGRATSLVEHGATELGSPAEAWSKAEACITSVADSAALLAVALGPEGLAGPAGAGKTLIDMSTVSAEASSEVAEAARRSGVRYLRAPVSGNPMVVRGGNLTILVSGEESTLTDCRELLTAIGPNLFYLGTGEVARVVKLALNLMVAGTAQLLAECIALSEANGVDRARLLEVVGGSVVGSPFVKVKTGPLIADDYRSTFTTRLMRKDLGMILDLASQSGVPLPVTAEVSRLLDTVIEQGMGDLDFMALLPSLQRAAGS